MLGFGNLAFIMALIIKKEQVFVGEGLRDMTIEDLQEFSNIFASEFNNSSKWSRIHEGIPGGK